MTVADQQLFPVESDIIGLQYGAPDPTLLPIEILKRHSLNTLSRQDAHFSLQYGPSLGSLQFRMELSKLLSSEYNGMPVKHENLCVTSGASQSFFNLLRLFTYNDSIIILENPTYFLALKMLQDQGFDLSCIQTIQTDKDGIDTKELEQKLSQLSQTLPLRSQSKDSPKRFNFFLYLVPTFGNPTGHSVSIERRKELIRLAREYDMLIVCDDVYQLLSFDNYIPPPRLISFDLETLGNGFGNVISNCSFSKLFAPGMRLGWIESSPGIIQQLKNTGILYSGKLFTFVRVYRLGGCSNHFAADTMARIISSGDLKTHLDHVKKIYQERRDGMIQILNQFLTSNQVSFDIPKGGYFIWLEFKDKTLDTQALLNAMYGGPTYRGIQSLEKDKVQFTPGNRFSVNGNHGHCLRLSFGMYTLPQAMEGCKRLCLILNKIF